MGPGLCRGIAERKDDEWDLRVWCDRDPILMPCTHKLEVVEFCSQTLREIGACEGDHVLFSIFIPLALRLHQRGWMPGSSSFRRRLQPFTANAPPPLGLHKNKAITCTHELTTVPSSFKGWRCELPKTGVGAVLKRDWTCLPQVNLHESMRIAFPEITQVAACAPGAGLNE